MESELSDLQARHEEELSALRDELDNTVEEYSVLSYNSRVVCVLITYVFIHCLHKMSSVFSQLC